MGKDTCTQGASYELPPPNYERPLALAPDDEQRARDIARQLGVDPQVVVGQCMTRGFAWAQRVWVPQVQAARMPRVSTRRTPRAQRRMAVAR